MSPRPSIRALLMTAFALVLGLGLLPAAPAVAGSPAFPAPVVDRVGPGVQVVTAGIRCTANFAFRDRAGHRYLGYAARCAGRSGTDARNACRHRSLPLGTPVRFVSGAGSDRTLGHGVLRYSSWLAMGRAGTRDPRACRGNDFALVQVVGRATRHLRPSVAFWDGPGGAAALPGRDARLFGSAGQLHDGVRGLVPSVGRVQRGGHWTVRVSTTGGLASDIGTGYVDRRGHAVGILVTGAAGPQSVVGSLELAMRFARRHGVPGLRVLPGGSAFHPSAVL